MTFNRYAQLNFRRSKFPGLKWYELDREAIRNWMQENGFWKWWNP